MSKTEGIDQTIELLNGMLASAATVKEKLGIADRLLRAYGMKLKHADETKGGKFSGLEGTNG